MKIWPAICPCFGRKEIMNEQNHLNMDSGAQGGDNENQVPQIAGLNPALTSSMASDTGADNAGTPFDASSMSDNSALSSLSSDADTKSDQTDYSTTISNDDLLASADGNGQTSGVAGAGSVENATVSMGDVNKGAGAGSGPLTGG